MIRDLSQANGTNQTVSADTVVVGAGLAGLAIASDLSRRGCRVVVLESGGMTQLDERHPLNEVVCSDALYRGAEEGRFRCLGGTSTRWGGAMLPFRSTDFALHPQGWDIEWPITLADLDEPMRKVERLFGLPVGPYEIDRPALAVQVEDSFLPRSAKWPTFRNRNVAHIFRSDLSKPQLEIWLNATATQFALSEAGRLTRATAVSPSGARLAVEAPYFVFAAGAIESTRLLLLLDAQHEGRIFAPDDVLGRYFFDHLSAFAATITPRNQRALIKQFGLQLGWSGMRDYRLEPSPSLRTSLDLPGGFAHMAAWADDEDGYVALRQIYRAIQRGELPRWAAVAPLFGHLDWLANAVWWRIAYGRVYPPHSSELKLNLVIEQMPHADNRITLSKNRVDAAGSPLAQIDWRIRPQDYDAFAQVQRALIDYWNRSFAGIAAAEPISLDESRAQMFGSGGIYHPGGSTRMASSRTRGVVDAELRTFNVGNLYVVSTSTFPSGGSANPSFTLLALALRAAGTIARELRRAA